MNKKEILTIILLICVIFSLQAVSAADSGSDSTDGNVLSVDNNVSSYALPNSESNGLVGNANEGSFTDLQGIVNGGSDIILAKNYTYNSATDSALITGVKITGTKTINGNGNVIIDGNHMSRIFFIAPGANVTLKGITFVNANATVMPDGTTLVGHGGSIFTKGVVHIDNCIFRDNTATKANGGAVFINGFGSTITNSYFENNRAIKNPNNMQTGVGGSVFLNASNITIKHSEFIKNWAGMNGGGVGSSGNGIQNCTITNCTFTSNTANGSAGGIGMQSSNFRVCDSTFKYNEAKGMFTMYPGNGGGIVMRGWDSYAYNCTFINNTAKQHGGAAFSTNTTYNPLNNNTGFVLCTFINNTAGSNGGAVDWAAGATHGYIEDCTFTNNTAKRSGGAVHWSGHYGIISNSTFTNNNATGEVTSEIGGITGGGDGGAIVWVGSYGIINNSCIFTDNYAKNRGGAIYLHGNSTENCTNITVYCCMFVSNYAGINGGAVDWHDGSHDGGIYKSSFDNNAAGSNGGAVFWSGHHGEILNSNFTNNTAKGLLKDEHGNIGDGGAVIWSGINGTVENCRFIDNTANKNENYDFGGRGGAIYLQNCTHGNCENTTFRDVYFKNNTAGTNGGAVDWHSGAHDGLVENATFINNTAKRSGGAIFWNGHNGTIRNANFTNNRALGIVNATSVLGDITSGGDGGAVMWSGALGTVENVRFINNTAAKRGGAVFLQSAANETCDNVKFDWCVFIDNNAGTNGGAIDWQEGASHGNVSNSRFENNIANRSGGAVFWSGHNGTVHNSNFTNNKALGIAEGKTPAGIITLGGDAGALMWNGAIGTIDECMFINNTAAKRGGAVFMQEGATENCYNTTFSHSKFINNTAGTNGGAIDWHRGAANGTIEYCSFENNIAYRSAGAVFWNGRNGTIMHSNFTQNEAKGIAWAISVLGDNNTGGDGGAIMWSGAVGLVDDCNFINNTAAKRGGGIFLEGTEIENCYNTTFENSYFERNVAGSEGGAINWDIGAENGYVYNVTFVNNTAHVSGGAVHWNGYNGTIRNSTFKNNRAIGDVYLYNMTITMDNVIVKNDTLDDATKLTDGKLYVLVIREGTKPIKYELYVSEAREHGHVWVKLDETTEIKASPFDWAVDEFFGGNGGSIIWHGDVAHVDGCKFIVSDSARRGGAAYMTGGDHIEFTNCTFENCTSGTNGGGVDWLAGANYGKVIDCNFTNTRAARSAGAIYYDGDYGEMRNIIIKNATSYGGAINESADKLVKYAGWDLSHWDTNTTGGDAGAIMFTGDHITVYNVNVTDCTAAGRGGAVFLQDNHNVTFELCWFENNRALGIANNTFNDPYDTSSGLNRELTGEGGAIGFDVGATESSIISSTFVNNYALNYGGAVHFRQGASEDKIINSTFDKNHANEDGGALYIDGDDCELHNSTFDNNYAGDDGGAIFWKGQGGTIYNITCNNNSGLSTHGNSKGGTICLTGNDISLSDSSFKQSYAKVTGGAIFVTGNNVNITGSDFKDCNATDSTGGALHLLGNNTLVRDCTFEECHADAGNAVYTEGNYIKIINSTFNNNNGTGDGGALYVLGHHSELHNSTFTNNFAGDDGGAIYWDGDKGTIYNITCENNKGISFNESNSKGGTICLTGDDVTISNSTFKNTSAKDDGGAIYISGNHVDVIDSVFENCNSSSNGGAIYVQGDNTDIIDSTFENCNATLGGAIYVEGDGATISAVITNTQALGKESYNITIDRKYYKDTLKEIGFDIEDIIEYLNNVTFENVTAENVKTLNNTLNALKDITGHILVGDGVNTTNITIALNLVNQLIGNLTQINSTLSDGGDKNIILKLLSEISAVGDELTDLYDVSQNMELPGDMKKQVDDMIAYLDTVVPGTISTADIDTLNKTLKDIEQAIEKIVISGAFNSSSIDVALSLIDDLNAKLTAIDPQHTLTGLDCTEVVNELNNLSKFAESLVVPETDGRGGAIYISGNGATIHDSEMSYTTAVDGGAVFITGDDVTVINTYFHNIEAVEDGGAIYITGQRGKLYNSNFTNNTVGDDGGAIYWEGNYGDIYNIVCINNNGTGDGLGNHSSTKGGTMIINGDHTTVSKSSFANSYAAILGGTIYVTGNDVNITDSSFKNSTVGNSTGGAIHILGNGTGILNCIIEDTFAPENGGAIFVEGNNATITAKFRNTNATTSGGSIYVDGNNTWIINSTFDNTYAFGHDGNGGGAIYVEGQSATIEKSNFTHTYANRNNLARGGAIFIHGNNTDVIESNFKEAHSNIQGGAIYVNGINATINGSQFDTCSVNSPGSEGGAIYIKGENTTVEGSNFINSTSVLNGGAIYINGLNATVKDSNFTDSSVTGNGGTPSGGAIYIQEDYASIEGSIFKHSTVPNSIGQGGTIFIDGNHTIIKSSVFESSSAKTGGTLYLEGDSCTVSDSSFNDSYAKTNGGAMYSTGSNSTVSNSNFTNNLAEESGGALYWYGGAHSKYNTVDGCIFTNNTAHGNTTSASQTRGGGAIYWSENGEYGTVKNSEFYYNSVQSTIDKKVDGGAILWDKSYHALVDNCRFVGNFVTTNGDSKQAASAAEWDWAQGGAMYLRPNNNYTVKNCLFENCSSSKEAGALYIQGKTSGTDHMITLENCKFINNVAEAKGKDTNSLINGGGAIQIKQCTNSDFKNLTFINNTANKGGALCVFDSVSNLVVDGANFTKNKADRGSAISASKGFTLKNAVLLENTATTETFDLTFNRNNNGTIDILLEGKDNRLNAMYVSVNGINVKCNNVTYWTNNNISIGKTAVTNANQGYTAIPVPEAGISVTVEIFDGDNNKLHEGIYATDENGKIHLDIEKILTPPYSTDNIYVNARLTNEDYYTMAERTSRFQNVYIINASALDTIFHRNTTVTAEILAPNNGTGQAANGTISIYFDGEFVGNITVVDSKGTLEDIPARLGTDGKFLEVGNHTVFLKYWGDANFDVANTTVSFNVTKAQSNLTVGFNDVGYDLYVNVTIFDEFDDKAYWDANGTATVKFYSENNPTVLVRSAEVKIVNGYGQTMIPDLLPRNYTVITTFSDDHNYNSSVNSTRYALLQKQFAAVFVEVNAYDIMVNDTIYINVTIVPPDGYNVPGNVTLYLDNKGYNLTLTMGPHNATAKFNITNLTAGPKKVVVFYEGSKLLEPAKGEADFRVHKYNTTISANVTNITHIQKEIINITLLNDTTGVVSVFVDGKEYFGRIVNGTASIELPQLAVGEYNVTVYYEGDGKYNNATNKTTFYVTRVTPEMIIDIENVTYGNSTHIVVTLPDCTEGNVSIEIDGTPFDVPKPVKDGRVEFVVEYLTAGNYTLKATYSGDINHTAVSGEQKFTVYKANRTIIIEVQNITYGEIEHIKVFVNATGNVTIFVDGRNETIELNESDVPATILRAIVNAISEYKGKAALDVYNLNVGVYPVDVIYHGNANYNEASAKATFIVSQVSTGLVIDTQDVPVWNNEYVNVTVRNSTGGIAVNATGNITVYIDGERHSAKIIDGVARFNITTSRVGSKVVWAFYDGDINFIGNKTMKTFTVQQRNPFMNVTAQNITVGQNGNITVELPANATGHVVIEVIGDNAYIVYPNNGHAAVYPKNLKEGTYLVNVEYFGDAYDNYRYRLKETYFTVSKSNTAVEIDVNSTVYGNKVNITVKVDAGVEGNITIRLNDTEIGTYGIVGGWVNITVDDLAAGNYTVYASYSGNGKYNINSTSKGFEVTKVISAITIQESTADAATNATIVVKINETATGNITITVNGTKYNATIENGVATFTIDQLLSGQYDIKAEYDGDNNYTAAVPVTLTNGLTVTKVSCYQINVTANDTKVGVNTTIIVKVPIDATGNVSIYIDGLFEENATIDHGIAQLNVTRPYGNHTVNVTFTDAKYGPRYAICDFWVFKHDSPLVIDVDSILVGDVAYINVTAPSDNVTIEINGKSYNMVKYENGIAYFEVSGLGHGNKTVIAIYGGSDKYLANTTTKNFTVDKRNSYIKVNVTNSTVGSGAFINVTVPDDAIGYVVVTLNNANYTINLTGGKGNVTVYGLENTTYDVYVTYIGDEKYLSSTNSTKLAIDKLTTTFEINGTNITVGASEFITFETPDNITGLVKVEINDKNYTAFIYEGKGNLTVYGLPAGDYNVTVYFEGNNMYLPAASAMNNFTVNQTTTGIVIVPQNITYGGHETIVIYINATGTVNVTVDTFSVTNEPIVDGKVTIDVDDYLTAGNYTVYVDYNGNVNYTSSSAQKDFEVAKADPTMTVEVQNITYGDIEHITVNVKSSGNVTIKVDGREETIVLKNGQTVTVVLRAIVNSLETFDGTAVLDVKGLNVGEYPVTVTYNGNENYNAKTIKTTFFVTKDNVTVGVDVADIRADGKEVINVTLSNINATGNVIINVDGKNYTRNISEGKANLTLSGLSSATHSVVVIYEGDNNFNGNWTSATFDVDKLDSTSTITLKDPITILEKQTIKVEVTDGATGYVVITVDDKDYYVPIVGKFATLELGNLTNKTYDVDARYLGDENYYGSTSETKFNVTKVASNVTVKVENITLGDVAVVNITVTPGATGNVTVTIGNEFNKTVGITDGIITVLVPGLTVGDKTVNVTYNGDGKYLPNDNSTTFSVGKINSTSNIEIVDNGNGTVTVIVPQNATGNVTIYVDGKNFTANVTDGIAVVTLENVTPGKHNLTAVYSGDGNYTNVTAYGNVTIPRLASPISMNVTDIYVGDVAYINVTAPTGDVTIEINGKTYAPTSFSNGVARFVVENLAYGNKTVAVNYAGNSNYTENFTTANFTVSKRNSFIRVNATDGVVDGEVIINVTVPANAIGYVVVNVNGTNYTINLTDGQDRIAVNVTQAGLYNVTATYIGDDQYLSSEANTTFNVDKLASFINVTVSNNGVIPNGTDAVIYIKVPGDINGMVNVTVWDINRNVNTTYTVHVYDGNGTLHIGAPLIGNYKVTAAYLENRKYLGNENYTSFEVYDNKKQFDVRPRDVYVDQTTTVTVSLLGNHTGGNVTIIISNAGGEILRNESVPFAQYSTYLNASFADWTLPLLNAGRYDVKAIYTEADGDYVYTYEGNNSFNVTKLDSQIKIKEIRNITVGENATVELEIVLDVKANDGNISVFVDGREYKTNTSSLKVTVPGLGAGNYTVEAFYHGNRWYLGSNASAIFKVDKNPAPISINVTNSKVGEVEQINVTLTENITGRVVLDVGDNHYYANITNGMATFNITGLAAGEYNVTATYDGDYKYFANSTAGAFTVSKHPSQINITISHDGIVANGTDVNITVHAPVDATGKVNITVSDDVKNTTYTIYVNDGVGVLHLETPEIGIYNVTAKYLGDGKYIGSENRTLFEVYITGKSLAVETENVTVAGNESIKVWVSGNRTGENVTIFVYDSQGTLVAEQNATFDEFYNSQVNMTSAKLTLDKLPAGDYTVDAIYLERNGTRIIEHTGSGRFTVSKLPSTISIKEIRNITVGENATIELVFGPSEATGNISVFVNGVEHIINTTSLTITVPNLHAEEYFVHAFYYGDHNYYGSNDSAVFKVSKAVPVIKVNATNITVGDSVLIEITAPGDIENPILVDVDGVGYYVNITAGKGKLYVPSLASGNYNVTARYLGDDKYTEGKNTTIFKVSKTSSSVNVTVDDITVGDKAVINIETPKDLCGNVTVSVDGKNHTVFVSGGVGTLVVPDLGVGPHTVNVTFDGCKKYEPSNSSTTFNVNKVKLNENDIKVVDQGNGTVIVLVPGNATGNVTITVDGKNFTADVVNGTAVVQLDNVTPGTHNAEVIYSGDDTHDAANTTAIVTAPKYDSPMNITVSEIKSGENGTVTVTLPENATGNVTVRVDGKNYTVEIVDGVAVVEIGNLTAGNKTFVVEYAGDDNYVPVYAVGNFTVVQSPIVPDITVVDNGNGTVVVVLPEDASGNVTITVDGKNYAAEVVNGTAVVQLDNVTPGTHEAVVTYSGDDKYANATKLANVTAPKYDSPMNITVGEIKSGENGTITVTLPENATGNITVSVDGKQYVVEVIDGVAVVEVGNLTAGNKTFVVEYSGDDNYVPVYAVGNFTVVQSPVVPDVFTVVDNGNGTVVVVLPEDATGNVTITVDGKNFTAEVVNGTAIVKLENVTPGTHEVEVIYSGDDKYTNVTKVVNVTAPKYDSPMNITVGEIKSGENGTITVTLPENATGNVTVSVDGKVYTAEVVNGTAVVEVGNLTAGNKTVVVEYSGDGNYTSGYAVGNFTVEQSPVVPDVFTVVDNGNGTVVVVLPEDATGNVTITVDGKNFTAEVVNGTAIVKLENVTPGTHEVEVIYSGDDKYTNVTKVVNVTAPKYDSPMNITVGEIKSGENGTIIVTLPENATGNVTVSVDGKTYIAEVVNGTAVVEVGNLTAGNKTVVVEYSGDGNYTSGYAVGNFTVEQSPIVPDITVVDQGNGTIVVVVPEDATGNVTITVDGKDYTAEVVNGTAVVQLDDVTPGAHDVEVFYSGDSKYANSTSTARITAPKYDTPIKVGAPASLVGDKAVITVSVPDNATGNVTIEIDGVKYVSQINGGKAVFEIENLTAGTKTIAVEYAGDGNYVANHTTGNITISKCPSTVSATITDIGVGENVTITVNVPEDATGQVLIDIDGVGYYVNVTNGVGVAQIPRMPNGVYDVNLTYTGDDKYLPSSSKSSFNVNKIPSFVIPTAEDIVVGENEVILFTLPSDATGTLEVIINGESFTVDLDDALGAPVYESRFTVAISDGEGVLVLSGLSAGEYNVVVTYGGNYKYLNSSNSTTFRVSASDCEVNVIDLGNGTVKVFVSDNATGNVTIKVGNETYTAPVVNGEAVIDLNNLSSGNHQIEVTYSGDDKHSAKTVVSEVDIPKKLTPISVSVEDINVGETEHIVVTLPDGASGTVIIEINAKQYNATIKDGKAVFDIEGLAFGNKTVAVTYDGDDNYVRNFTTAQFEVKKLPSNVTATSKDIKYGKDGTIKIELPKDATGHVTVTINGVKYSGEVINGKAVIVIPDLPAGDYDAVVTYDGDDKYSPSITTTSFRVVKDKTPISATGDNIKVGEDGTVVVNLPSDATGTVTIEVAGKTYTSEVVDGKAVFKVTGLSKGVYTVHVYYSGDDNYDANETVTSITVEGHGHDNPINPQEGDGVDLSKYPTGNPILILLLILLAIGSTQIRRFRK